MASELEFIEMLVSGLRASVAFAQLGAYRLVAARNIATALETDDADSMASILEHPESRADVQRREGRIAHAAACMACPRVLDMMLARAHGRGPDHKLALVLQCVCAMFDERLDAPERSKLDDYVDAMKRVLTSLMMAGYDPNRPVNTKHGWGRRAEPSADRWLLEWLVAHIAGPPVHTSVSSCSRTTASAAFSLLDWLTSIPAIDVNIPTSRAPLLRAAYAAGHVPLFRLLLSRGARPESVFECSMPNCVRRMPVSRAHAARVVEQSGRSDSARQQRRTCTTCLKLTHDAETLYDVTAHTCAWTHSRRRHKQCLRELARYGLGAHPRGDAAHSTRARARRHVHASWQCKPDQGSLVDELNAASPPPVSRRILVLSMRRVPH